MSAEPKPLRCHRCGSAELALYEAHLETVKYDEGLYLDADGSIRAHGTGISSGGEIQPRLTEIECEGCKHRWHPRRWFAGEARLDPGLPLGETLRDGIVRPPLRRQWRPAVTAET